MVKFVSPAKRLNRDRDAVNWALSRVDLRKHESNEGRDPHWVVQPTEKHWQSLLRCTQQKGSFNP